MFAVVVIGPPGSGKTNVLTALHDALADSDVAHAVIEVEAVAWAPTCAVLACWSAARKVLDLRPTLCRESAS